MVIKHDFSICTWGGLHGNLPRRICHNFYLNDPDLIQLIKPQAILSWFQKPNSKEEGKMGKHPKKPTFEKTLKWPSTEKCFRCLVFSLRKWHWQKHKISGVSHKLVQLRTCFHPSRFEIVQHSFTKAACTALLWKNQSNHRVQKKRVSAVFQE